MKKLLPILLAVCLLLTSCKTQKTAGEPAAEEPTEYTSGFRPIDAIDHCVLEPDDRAALSDDGMEAYRALMEAMLDREDSVALGVDSDTVDYLLDLLRQSPFYYFVSDAVPDGDTVRFTYAYPADEQAEMLAFIDGEMLRISNYQASDDDNALDVLFKIYFAVTTDIEYDMERTDNKQLGSPLFVYPADEVYKTLYTKKGLCYGFAYVMRFALLQRGIDCFCVSGLCSQSGSGHEWIIFRWDDAYFHCDPTWDRVSNGSPKLYHFGKTDSERFADNITGVALCSCADPAYEGIACTDDRFSILRGVGSFEYLEGHRYQLDDLKGHTAVFDTETFTIEGSFGTEGTSATEEPTEI